jgi:hypothetical protein
MIGVAIATVASILAASTISLIARHGKLLLDVGMLTGLLAGNVLLPAAPFVVLLGAARIGVVPSVVLASICCLPSLLSARRAIKILERKGTDRVNVVLDAMWRLVGAAIIMLLLVVVTGIFAALHSGIIGPKVTG